MKKKSSEIKIYILRLFLALITLISVVLLWKSPFVLTALLILISIIFILIQKSKKQALIVYIKYGLAGACAEAIAILSGAWNYSLTNFIPIWLPLLWGIAALFIFSSRGQLLSFINNNK